MNSSEIRRRFLAFFQKRGHAIIPSASLVTPDLDGVINATLFNTAGMQPLVPYLLGKPHPAGNRLADIQKCLRTTDINEVGDNRHLTFFEMLGNWSLGDYFKKEAIEMSYGLLTDKDEGFGLDANKLYVTVFNGDGNAGKDNESAEIWRSAGIRANRIYFRDAGANWWPAIKGKDDWTGPTGPCSEMFYDITTEGLGDMTPEQYGKADDEGKVVEIWNDVFMEYEKENGKIMGALARKNIDTGAGFERLCAVIQKKPSVFETDLFAPLMEIIRKESKIYDEKAARIFADHIRASIFLVADGVIPSNKDRGYVLRRLIRRAMLQADKMGLDKEHAIGGSVALLSAMYAGSYPELKTFRISDIIVDEDSKFRKALEQGIREFNKGAGAFELFTTYGFPIELITELASERGLKTDMADFERKMTEHQALSRAGGERRFKGGLADAEDPMVVRYHTATHLLHQALRDVLGEGAGDQKGSNITADRLRFDFVGQKLTEEQRRMVEDIINGKIAAALPVNRVILPREEAEKTGARHFFGEKYGDEVSVYFIGKAGNPPTAEEVKTSYSKEFCGGPHVANTAELAGPEGRWRFKIQKEEAVARGVRRIKAVLE